MSEAAESSQRTSLPRDTLGCDDPEYFKPSRTCRVCGKKSRPEPNAYLCFRCWGVLRPKNLTAAKKAARFKHMCESVNPDKGFVCAYTGVTLDLEDERSDRYAEWEHRIPTVDSTVVLSTRLVNRMKSDMSFDQFEVMVRELVRYWDHPDTPFNEQAFPERLQTRDDTGG